MRKDEVSVTRRKIKQSWTISVELQMAIFITIQLLLMHLGWVRRKSELHGCKLSLCRPYISFSKCQYSFQFNSFILLNAAWEKKKFQQHKRKLSRLKPLMLSGKWQYSSQFNQLPWDWHGTPTDEYFWIFMLCSWVTWGDSFWASTWNFSIIQKLNLLEKKIAELKKIEISADQH